MTAISREYLHHLKCFKPTYSVFLHTIHKGFKCNLMCQIMAIKIKSHHTGVHSIQSTKEETLSVAI